MCVEYVDIVQCRCVCLCFCVRERERESNIEIKSVSVSVCVLLSQITLNLSFDCSLTISHDITSGIACDITGDNTGCPLSDCCFNLLAPKFGGFDKKNTFRIEYKNIKRNVGVL